MKILNLLLASLLLISFSIACSNDDDPNLEQNHDCNFVQNDDDMDGEIDAIERALMTGCMDNEMNSKEDIENNLIGEWELVGFGDGWIYDVSQPCAYITISADEIELEFKNEYRDTITTHTWEIILGANNSFNYLKVEPEDSALWLSSFCSDYMFGDATPSDGDMHLYKKVR